MRVGSVLAAKWSLDALLGVGGSAAVYAATHRNGMRGAIKILHPHCVADDQLRARFLREGYVANKIGHPGAVTVLDDDIAPDGTVFLVMELLEGRSLERMDPGRPLTLADVVRIGDDLLDVLSKAHAAGIIHRDIKPANLFVTVAGQLKVLDFGIARLGEPTFTSDGSPATQTGLMMGTPAFMPPEQARGRWHEVDPRSDVWAVGATLLALMLGRRPRRADTANEELLLAMTEAMPPACRLMPSLPQNLGAVLDKAMAFKSDDRWASAHAMQRALRAAGRESEPTLAAAPTLVEKPPVQQPITTVLAPVGELASPVTQALAPPNPSSSELHEMAPSLTTSRAVLHTFDNAHSRTSSRLPLFAAIAIFVSAVATGGVLYLKQHRRSVPPQPIATEIVVATPAPTADPAPAATVVMAEPPPQAEPESSTNPAGSSAPKKARPAIAPRASGSANPAKYFDSRF
jgi:serine/threonine-protein kinase